MREGKRMWTAREEKENGRLNVKGRWGEKEGEKKKKMSGYVQSLP